MTVAVESVTGILGQLVSAQSIAIKDDWSGLGVPTTAHYSLTRSRDAFEGTGEFTVQSSRSASVPVMVPLEVAQDFLSRLARVPLVVGEYAPDIEYSDDYPSFSIDIQVNNQLVSVYSQSQFGEHIPWGADISGEKYTINSGIPAEALGILSPYLKHDETISNLIEEIRQEDMQNTPAP